MSRIGKSLPAKAWRQFTLVSLTLLLIVSSLLILAAEAMWIQAAVRSYVTGESLWSKAQKEAVMFLLRYARTGDEEDYRKYLAEIRVPLGDRKARIELEKPEYDLDRATQGFLEGRNHPDDVERMAVLFRRFRRVSFIDRAIAIWAEGDRHIASLLRAGERLHEEMQSRRAATGEVAAIVREIELINTRLTPLEDRFSDTLGEAARLVRRLLLILLTAASTLLIVLGAGVYFVLLKRDVRAREALVASEARKSAILEAALDCIVTMSHTGSITEFNPAAERTFGYSRGEALGRPLAELIVPPRLRERHEKGLARFLGGGGSTVLGRRVEITGMRKDGTEFPVELAIAATDCDGERMFTAYLRDIAERKRMEDELRDAHARAMEATEAKSKFLAHMSHEIRTPLNGVIGMIGLLGETKLTAEQKELAALLNDSAETLLGVIGDILDFSKIEAGMLTLESADFDLWELVKSTHGLFGARAKEKTLDFAWTIDEMVPRIGRGDPVRLRQILNNLVGNAIKFTGAGEVAIRVSIAESSNAERLVRFSVSDTGIGVSEEQRARLFQPFVQADSSVTRRFGGTGLGLAISKQLVEKMGGEIGMSSEPGSGSTFWFTLPF